MDERTTATEAHHPHFLGVWLDHDVARFVELNGDQVRCSEIHSDVGKKHRSTGGLRMPGKAFMKSFTASEKSMERSRAEHLRRYYESVMAVLRDKDRVVLLGPGAAKVELARRIRQDKPLSSHLDGVYDAQAMTERQLVAKVKQHFH